MSEIASQGRAALVSSLGITPNKIVLLVAGALIGYFVVIGVSNATHNAMLAREQRVLEGENSELVGSLDRLKAVETYVRSDTFIEGVAREQLNLVREGEVLVKVLPSITDDETSADGTPAPWWERLFGR